MKIMNNIYRIVLSALVVVSSAICNAQNTTSLQPGQGPNGLEMSKILTQLSNNEYQIDIETYVTGAEQTTVVQTVEPMDITLILDRSVSVNSNAYSYLKTPEMTAAKAFANSLYAEENRPKDASGHLGYHYVAALSMWSAGIYSDFDGATITDVNNRTTAANLKFTEFNETNKNALIGNYTQYTTGGSYWGGQNVMQVALRRAIDLYQNDNSGRGKVIVIFTAGGSMIQKQGGGDGEMNYALSRESVNLAHQLKDMGVKIYVVSVEAAKTSAKADRNHQNDLLHYYHYLSSNYNFEITNNSYEFNGNYSTYGGNESADDNPNHYYRTGKSTDATELAEELADIFVSIARESTSGGASVTLTEASTTVVDVVSNGFSIPADASDITLKAAHCSGQNGGGFIFEEPFTIPDATGHFPNASYYRTDNVSNTSPVNNGKVIKVNGFDFSENFVGYRENKSNPSLSYYDGYKLIISFKIVVDSSNEGGANVPTNTIESGIWNDGKQISAFEQPNAKIPNLVIVKKGLLYGESAIFNVSHDSSTPPTTVVLTQTSRNGDDVQKVIKIQKPGRYNVTESDWSWSYNTTLKAEYTKDDNGMDVTSDEGKARWKSRGYTEDGANNTPLIPTVLGTAVNDKTITRNVNDFTEDPDAKGTLFIFENSKDTSAPDHAEAMSNNVFLSGATSTTVKTE